MSASCDMTINVIGTDAEFESILTKLHEIEGKKEFELYPHYPFQVKEHSIYCHNGSCSNVWGQYYLEPDEDLFIELAMAAPNASFEVISSRLYEGGGGGCETYLYVEYKERKLNFKLQSYVDTMSLADLVNGEGLDNDKDEIRVAIVGRLKFHQNAPELEDYLENYDIITMPSISKKTDYVVCNTPESPSKKLEKAKKLNIPIISEAKAIRMFGDIYDFDEPDALVQDVTYQEFCNMYEVDSAITEAIFERVKTTDCDNFIVCGNYVSLDGHWSEKVYVLTDDNIFVKQKG